LRFLLYFGIFLKVYGFLNDLVVYFFEFIEAEHFLPLNFYLFNILLIFLTCIVIIIFKRMIFFLFFFYGKGYGKFYANWLICRPSCLYYIGNVIKNWFKFCNFYSSYKLEEGNYAPKVNLVNLNQEIKLYKLVLTSNFEKRFKYGSNSKKNTTIISEKKT
jgi:hypothetical protein